MIRVLVVDDSSVIRRILTTAFRTDPAFEVVGAAGDPYEARDLLVSEQPDVMTLDLHMPRMDGVAFLRKLQAQFPVPTVVVSGRVTPGSEVERNVLAAGASSVVRKPTDGRVQDMLGELKDAVRAAAGRRAPTAAAGSVSALDALVIGASTGGPPAVLQVLRALPATAPCVLIAQHMPAHFTGSFAARMNDTTSLSCQEAVDGAPLRRGRVYLAPGDRHLRVERRAGRLVTTLGQDGLVQGHRPSVDVLMSSAAQVLGARAVGVLLTGMGRDGAEGLLAMRRAGAWTFAQDEASSVVYGMPKAAAEIGAACQVLDLAALTAALTERANRTARAA